MKSILSIQIKKITLKVKFPCSICFAVKFDGRQNEMEGQEELKNGQARLNCNYTHEIQNDKPISQLKGSILIFLKTTSGRIPAGSVNLKLSKLKIISTKQISIINKCPDKNAFLEYELKLESVHNFDNLIKQRSFDNFDHFNSNKFSSSTINYNKIKSTFDKSLRLSNQSFAKRSQSPYTSHQEISSISFTKKNSLNEKQADFKAFDSYGYRDNQQPSQKLYSLQRQLQSTKSKLYITENDLTHKQSQLKQSQHQSRLYIKKHEQTELQLKTTTYKLQLLDKSYRQLSIKYKQNKQKYEEQKMAFETGMRRIEIRENSYKEQIKLLTDKFYNSENQKQRMVYDKNLSTNQYQARQKKLRQTYKERQKRYIEEKTLLEKKLDIYQKDHEKMIEQIDIYKQKYSQLLQKNHDFQLYSQALLSQKQKIKLQHNNLKYELIKIKNQKYLIQSNLQSNNKFNEERRLLKRQLSSKQIQNFDLKDTLSHIKFSQNKNYEYEKEIKQKQKQIKKLQNSYQNLQRQLFSLHQQLILKQNKISQLKEELDDQLDKNKAYKIRINQLQEQMSDMVDQYSHQQDDLGQKYKYYENELQNKNQILNQKLKNIEFLQKQCNQYCQNIQQKNKINEQCRQQIMKLQQHIQGLEQQKKQLENINKQNDEAFRLKQKQYKMAIDQIRQQLHICAEEHDQKMRVVLNRQAQAVERLKEKAYMLERVQSEKIAFFDNVLILKRQIAAKQREIQEKKQEISQLNIKLSQKALPQQRSGDINKLKTQLKIQIQRVNQLQISNSNLTNNLKQQQEVNKTTMRELQNQRHLFQKLKIQREQSQNKTLLKDAQLKKQKTINEQLTNIIKFTFSIIQTQSENDQQLQSLKLNIKRSSLSEIQPLKQQLIKFQHKIEQLLKQQHHSFSNSLSQSSQFNGDLKEIKRLKQELDQKEAQLIKLQKNVKNFQNVKGEVCMELSQINQILEELQNTIRSMEQGKLFNMYNISILRGTAKKFSGVVTNVYEKLGVGDMFNKKKAGFKSRQSIKALLKF